MTRFTIAFCLCIFTTDVFAEAQCRIDWGKKICEETDAPFVEILSKPDFENISDSHVDAINTKFCKGSGLGVRNNTKKLVDLASRFLKISKSELWSCLYYFDRTEKRISFMQAGVSCGNKILSR